MQDQSFFSKLQSRRSVLKRTRPGKDLPSALLYVEWISNESSRKLLDPEGNEHVLTDKTLESHYKACTKSQAKTLIEEHWADAIAGKGETLRKDA